MRIADILFSHAVPGALVVDLTAETAGLSSHAALSPELGLPYRRGLAGASEGAALALVLHSLPARGQDDAPPPDLSGLAGLAQRVAHIVFSDRIEAFLELGILDLATRAGHALSSTHITEHRVFRFAGVFERPEGEPTSSRLRLMSEYRLDKLALGELERALAKATRERDGMKASLVEARAGRERLREEIRGLQADHQQLRVEHRLLGVEYQRMTRARDEALGQAGAAQDQVQAYQARLAATFLALERSRGSFAFRLGRATWAAKSAGVNVFAMPRRWLRGFRGRDEVLEKLRERPRLGGGAPLESPAELVGIEKSVLLLGLEPAAGPGPMIAGVVGSRFAVELAASARFRPLAPHDWRHLLEAELPAYVLVTADGLLPGAAWGDWGTPGGRDGAAMLRELVAWCRGMQLPIVYWDTIGAGQVPPGVRFDAVFAVGAGRAPGGRPTVEVLLPAVEPLVWNPLEVARVCPRHPIFVGAFDRRGDRVELAATEALLGAAAGRGLEIFDVHRGLQGPLASTVRFPDELQALVRRRPPAEAERSAIKRAGILLCGNPSAGPGVPSWDVLRGLAMGVHVVSTPLTLDDLELTQAIELAGDQASAAEALDRLAARPLLDEVWRRGFDRILAGYSLRDRLDRIAERCGVAAVAEPPARLAVIARVQSAAEGRALGGFLAAQTVQPAEVRVLVDAEIEIEIDALLGEGIDSARVEMLRATDPRASGWLGDSAATHVLCWSASTPELADAVAELSRAAALTEVDVLALTPGTGASGAAVYGYGPLPAEAVVAVRRTAVLGHLGEGRPPEDAAAALAAGGTGCLIEAHPAAGRADSNRSVA